MSREERRSAKRARPVLRPVLAAALAVCLLSAIAFAAAPGAAGMLADYFAGRWEEANEQPLSTEQLDFIGNFTQVVGVSDTCNGVTVTLEAVSRGELRMYLLVRVEGLDAAAEELVDEDLRFTSGLYRVPEGDELSRQSFWRTLERRAEEDGSLMMLLSFYGDTTEEMDFLTGCEAVLKLKDLSTYERKERADGTVYLTRKDLIAEGPWRLEFTLEPVEESEAIVLRDLMLPALNIENLSWDPYGPVKTKEVRVTSTDLHVYWAGNGATFLPDEISLILDDGSRVGSVGGRGAWPDIPFAWASEDKDVRNHFIVPWDLPVDLAHAAALQIGDETFPLRQEEEPKPSLSEEQLALIGKLTQAVGVSDTVDGVTVTLEAVTAGESAVWMLLSVEGLEAPAEELAKEHLRFAEGWLKREPVRDGYYQYTDRLEWPAKLRAAEDGQLMILLNVNGASLLESGGELSQDGCPAVVEVKDLYTYNITQLSHWERQVERKELLAKGTWRLEFTLEPPETSEAVTLRDVTIPAMTFDSALGQGSDGLQEMTVEEIRVTSTEARIQYRGEEMSPLIDCSLLLDDGTVINGTPWWIQPLRLAERSDRDLARFTQHFYVSWQAPVDLTHAVALKVGNETIPLP